MKSTSAWIVGSIVVGITILWLLLQDSSKKGHESTDIDKITIPTTSKTNEFPTHPSAPNENLRTPRRSTTTPNPQNLENTQKKPILDPAHRSEGFDDTIPSAPSSTTPSYTVTDGLPVHPTVTPQRPISSAAEDGDSDPVREMVWSTDKSGIQSAMNEVTPQIQECYDGWIQSNPDMQGKLVVRFTIGREAGQPEAKVLDLTLPESELENPLMESCVLQVVSGLRFEVPENGKLVVNYPFRFSTEPLLVPNSGQATSSSE